MDAYIYEAALLCSDCREKVIRDLHANKTLDTGDSDDFPQGPYSDGGGEADCPQHCDQCNVFLENPLTEDGYKYVDESLARWVKTGQGIRPILDSWSEFYGRKFPAVNMDIAEAFQIVIDLARQNAIDIADNPEEHARQHCAIDMLEDLAMNEYQDA